MVRPKSDTDPSVLDFLRLATAAQIDRLRACSGNIPKDGPRLARVAGYHLRGAFDREAGGRGGGLVSISEAIGWAFAEEGDEDPSDADIRRLQRLYSKHQGALELAERMEFEVAVKLLAIAMCRSGLLSRDQLFEMSR
ncbi:MAG: hypothetical protein MJA83_18610 [Gammaproteobacteria bacterium]|nr:hypothetical protein [Gammaproteobacteria bacterium]